MFFPQVLADNLLSRIQLTTDDDGGELLDGGEKGSAIDRSSANGRDSADDDDDWVNKNCHSNLLLILFHFEIAHLRIMHKYLPLTWIYKFVMQIIIIIVCSNNFFTELGPCGSNQTDFPKPIYARCL